MNFATSAPAAYGPRVLLSSSYACNVVALGPAMHGYIAQITSITTDAGVFDDPVTLQPNTQHWFLMAGGIPSALRFGAGLYAAGTAWQTNAQGTYIPLATLDLNFTLQGTPIVTPEPPPPSSSPSITPGVDQLEIFSNFCLRPPIPRRIFLHMTWAWQNPVASPHDHPPHPMRAFAERLESVFAPLIMRVAACTGRLPLLLPLACTRLQRARARILSILHRVAEGTWRAPRPHTPRTTPRKRTPSLDLPRRRAWLGHVTDHHVRAHASQLTHLLNDPGTQAILARAPAAARAAIARALRGPTRLLGLELPANLQFAASPRPPRIRTPRPRPVSDRSPRVLPTDRPIPRSVLAFARYNRRRFGKGV